MLTDVSLARSISGRVMIGTAYIDRNIYMGSVAVDELAMWNRALSETEVALSNVI